MGQNCPTGRTNVLPGGRPTSWSSQYKMACFITNQLLLVPPITFSEHSFLRSRVLRKLCSENFRFFTQNSDRKRRFWGLRT